MLHDLSAPEIAFLRELKFNPLWQSILDKIERREPRAWKPAGEASEQHKIHEWIYESGRAKENADLIFTLKAGARNG